MQGNVISSEYTINEYLHTAHRQNLKSMYLCNKKCQLVIKLNIVIELKVSVTENFIQLWFCRPFVHYFWCCSCKIPFPPPSLCWTVEVLIWLLF